jgi:KDO2-lipid IV(A) lauroyltransferase
VRDNSPTVLRQLGWGATALAYDIVSLLLRLLPVDAASALGGSIVGVLGPLTSKHRIVLRNLELAFPELDAQARERLAREHWNRIGRTFAEFPLMDRITPASGRVEVRGLERLTDLVREGRAAVLVSGHLSNWEPMMTTIVASGLPCAMSYRPANNPYIDRRINAVRRRYGVTSLAAKSLEGTRLLLSTMRQGRSAVMLNDQRDNGGIEAPFFGRIVRTAPGGARLAFQFDAPLIPMSVARGKGARFVVTVHEPIATHRTGDRTLDMQAMVAGINSFVEARVRERPSEWMWAHRRWPLECYEAGDRRAAPQSEDGAPLSPSS